MDQYNFRRPVFESVPVKRSRRKYEVTEDTHTKFGYVCFECSALMDIKCHTEMEIECGNCGSRIMRKNNSEKTEQRLSRCYFFKNFFELIFV